MKKIFFAMMIALGIYSSHAHANQSCYSSTEFEAEQGLRIHSELMVISLNCQHVYHRAGNLQIQYRDFTRRHSNLISSYEGTMKQYFARNGSANPERDINDLRTSLANKVSTDAAKMRPNVFCRAYGDRITQALRMDQNKLRRWAATPFPGYPVSRPVCSRG